jgi:hypothetical protein
LRLLSAEVIEAPLYEIPPVAAKPKEKLDRRVDAGQVGRRAPFRCVKRLGEPYNRKLEGSMMSEVVERKVGGVTVRIHRDGCI